MSRLARAWGIAGVLLTVAAARSSAICGALVEATQSGADSVAVHVCFYVFVLEGTISLENEGKPTVTLKAGECSPMHPGSSIKRSTMEARRRNWRRCSLPRKANRSRQKPSSTRPRPSSLSGVYSCRSIEAQNLRTMESKRGRSSGLGSRAEGSSQATSSRE